MAKLLLTVELPALKENCYHDVSSFLLYLINIHILQEIPLFCSNFCNISLRYDNPRTHSQTLKCICVIGDWVCKLTSVKMSTFSDTPWQTVSMGFRMSGRVCRSISSYQHERPLVNNLAVSHVHLKIHEAASVNSIVWVW